MRVEFPKYIDKVVNRAEDAFGVAEAAIICGEKISEHVAGPAFALFVEQAAATRTKKEVADLGETTLGAVSKRMREITKTSLEHLPLPAARANHIWAAHGPNSGRRGWEKLKMEDWLEVQKLLDNADIYLQENGNWIQILAPYKLEGEKLVGFAIVFGPDRNKPGRLFPVTFWKLDATDYKNEMGKVAGRPRFEVSVLPEGTRD